MTNKNHTRNKRNERNESAYGIIASNADKYKKLAHVNEAPISFRKDSPSSGRIEEANQTLKDIFGFSSFRPGQEKIVDTILGGNDILAIMPTSSGKSVCYQLPSTMMDGLTIVVSPLISLMRDQVTKMKRHGLRGTYIDHLLPIDERRVIMEEVLDGEYDILYVSPERLENDEFLRFAKQIDIDFLAIDEAHCVSQWGNDFRPAYANIPLFVETITEAQGYRPVIAAYTATATEEVRSDIARKLKLDNPVLAVSGFDRPNLSLKVEHVYKSNKIDSAVEYVREHEGKCGICYCLSRKDVEDLTIALKNEGLSAVAYHAGLFPAERTYAQNAWTEGRIDVVVATSAFGMGIDRPDVRFILSTSISDSLEAYYQQAGRAGRDTKPSECVLYWCEGDLIRWDWLIKKSTKEANLSETEENAVLALKYKQLLSMAHYAYDHKCLRNHILKYFGDTPQDNDGCGRCSACEKRGMRSTRERITEQKSATKSAANQPIRIRKRASSANSKRKPIKTTKGFNSKYVEWICPSCQSSNETRSTRSVEKCIKCEQEVAYINI